MRYWSFSNSGGSTKPDQASGLVRANTVPEALAAVNHPAANRHELKNGTLFPEDHAGAVYWERRSAFVLPASEKASRTAP